MSKKVVFIADFFVEQVLGGGELNNQELIRLLQQNQIQVEKVNSQNVSVGFLESNQNCFYIISNFVLLDYTCREWLTNNAQYIIYEHDHKYVKNRNPASYKDFVIPSRDLVNFRFYREAQKVICQSQYHKTILSKNLNIDNIISVGGNLWSEESLQELEKLSSKEKRTGIYSILDSPYQSKNTPKTVYHCQKNNLDYELVSDSDYIKFLDKLSHNEKFLFLPSTPETLSRVVCESRMMGMKVTTNQLVGACQEEWFNLKGKQLIDFMRSKKQDILGVFLREMTNSNQIKFRPKISIVTTFHQGEEFLSDFLKNITEQTVFKECELIIVDAASKGKESEIIKSYQKEHSNIVHIRTEEKLKPTPSINLAIQKSRGEYIHLSLIDDRKHSRTVEYLKDALDKNSDIGLVYGDVFVSTKPNETYEQNSKTQKSEHSSYEFSRENMIKCLPGPMPMWRYHLHESLGFFDDLDCNYADDWEMWLRMVQHGTQFKKIEQPVGLYLTGGRSQIDNNTEQRQEEAKIFFKYASVFGYNYNKHYNHFSQFVR